MLNESNENEENSAEVKSLTIEKLKTLLGANYNENEFANERLKEIVYSIKTFTRILMMCQMKMEQEKLDKATTKIIPLNQADINKDNKQAA